MWSDRKECAKNEAAGPVIGGLERRGMSCGSSVRMLTKGGLGYEGVWRKGGGEKTVGL